MPQCRHCAAEFAPKRNTKNLYCNNQCQCDHEYHMYIEQWLRREQPGSRGKTLQLSGHVRRYLHETCGTACSQCGWDAKHPVDGKPLTEIDHIDGDAANSYFENLRILCPNCHSMTPTFRARNKKSSRIR